MRTEKKRSRVALVLTGVVLLLAVSGASGWAAEGAPFAIQRFLVCQDVQDREPVGISSTFSSTTEKVYAFLEAVDIPAETTADFVWYHGSDELARVTVKVGQAGRWRTYANKNLYGLTGSWRVEIQDAEGSILGTVEFQVQ
jgi:hypothetical protein